ncbi:MAG: dynamin family protein [Oscillospiraceae bacterium]|nr:dynamin family protein [Oscillospiraceae bacterium]
MEYSYIPRIQRAQSVALEVLTTSAELIGERDEALKEKYGFEPGLNMEYEAQLLRDRADNISKGIFEVLFIGMFGSGKSALINALVGKSVVNMSPVPETAAITKLSFGRDRETAKIFYKDGTSRELGAEEYKAIRLINNPDVEETAYIELGLREELFGNLVQLVDSPGMGSSRLETEITLHYEPRANAIVFLINGLVALSCEERDRIQQKYCGRAMQNIFFVVTHADMITEGEDLVKENVLRMLKNVFLKRDGSFDEELYEKRVFYIDTEGALCVKTGRPKIVRVGSKNIPVDVDYEATGMPRFEAELTEYLTSDTKYITAYEDTLRLLANTYKALESENSRLQSYIQKNAAVLRSDMDKMNERSKQAMEISKKINEEFQRLYDNVDVIVRGELRKFVARVRVNWDEYFLNNPATGFDIGKAMTIVKFSVAEKAKSIFHNGSVSDEAVERLLEAVKPICDAIVIFDEGGMPTGGYIGNEFNECMERMRSLIDDYLHKEGGAAQRIDELSRALPYECAPDIFSFEFDGEYERYVPDGADMRHKIAGLSNLSDIMASVVIVSIASALTQYIFTSMTGIGWIFMIARTIKSMFGDGIARDNVATTAIIEAKEPICNSLEGFGADDIMLTVRRRITEHTELLDRRLAKNMADTDNMIELMKKDENAAVLEAERMEAVKKRYLEEFNKFGAMLGKGACTGEEVLKYANKI